MRLFPRKKKNNGNKPDLARPETRRVMMELLIALFIFGVLTITSVTAYTKAMLKYKISKQTTQIAAVLDYLTLNYTSNMNLSTYSEYQLLPILRKLKAVPNDMMKPHDKTYIYDVFDTFISVENHRTVDSNMGLFIGLYITDKKSAVDICRNLYTIAKEKYKDISFISINRRMENNTLRQFSMHLGEIEAGKTLAFYLKDTTMNNIDKACSVCKDASNCVIGIGHAYKKL